MGRRTVLLIVAALIALLGTSMVFIYARGADSRATASQEPVQVLKAVAKIDVGETLQDAESKGKLQLGSVPRKQVLPGAVNSIAGLGTKVALSAVYPNEQIISAKFGSSGDEETLTIPNGNIAISVNLSDTGRVAGFVTPGSSVAIFTNTTSTNPDSKAGDATRLLLPKVQVIAVGTTTVVSQTTTSAAGAQTTEQLPKTLFTLSVSQDQAERVMYAVSHGELTFALLNKTSKVSTGPGVTAKNLFR
jgi:pilus assembly protein CpaB